MHFTNMECWNLHSHSVLHVFQFWSYQIITVLSLQSLILLDLYRPISPIFDPTRPLPSFIFKSLVIQDLYRSISSHIWSYYISTVLSLQSSVLPDLYRPISAIFDPTRSLLSYFSNLWSYQTSTVLHVFKFWSYQISTVLFLKSLIILNLYRPLFPIFDPIRSLLSYFSNLWSY